MRDTQKIQNTIQTCLEQLANGQSLEAILAQYPELAEQLKPRLEAAQWLQARRASVEPRPGFLPASSRRVLSQIQKAQTRDVRPSLFRSLGSLQPFRTISRGIAAFLVIVMLFFVGKSTASAAQLALPGDALYPMKHIIEKARLALVTSKVNRAALHIEFVRERANELEALILEGLYTEVDASARQYELQVGKAVQTLTTVAEHNAARAMEFANDLEYALSDRVTMLKILGGTVPKPTQASLNNVIALSEMHIGEMENLYP